MDWSFALVAGVGYLVGSIPFGYLVARWVAGIDLRAVGSGNIGATNVGRILGKKWGLIVLALDAAKGLAPTLLLPLWCDGAPGRFGHLQVLAGVSAILGHMFPCTLGFRGGKGVATSLGVVAVLAPWATLVAFVVFAANFAATRIVSLGSILAAAAFAAFQWCWLQPEPWSADRWSLSVFSAAVPLLIILRHRSNIVRLLRGEEAAWSAGRRETPPAPAEEAAEP